MFEILISVKQLFTQYWSLILLITLVLSTAIQLSYYLLIYLRVAIYKQEDMKNTDIPVSVLICARDEEQNLTNNLPKILSQKYSPYEVFVILDACTDKSVDVVKKLADEYPNLRYTVITKDAKFTHGKKLALTIGIKGAKHNTLLHTDADCYPSSEHWIEQIAKQFEKGYEIVLGYGKYAPKKTLLNRMARYDTFFIAQQYLGMALIGLPYMGVGRNLAYKRSIYDKQGGFSKHSHIESGDDDLLVNAAANKNNCIIELSQKAQTISETPSTFKRWTRQKSRHLRASVKYKKKHIALLTLEPITRLITWIAPIALISISEWRYIAMALLMIRLVVFMTVIKLNMSKLNEKGIWLIAPIFDIILPIITFSLLTTNKFSKESRFWR